MSANHSRAMPRGLLSQVFSLSGWRHLMKNAVINVLWFILTLAVSLKRMGSFSSAPKILNEDTQDNDVDLPEKMSREELIDHCEQKLEGSPRLVRRKFTPVHNMNGNLEDKDKNSDDERIRILQWNVLSQALGQNNDSFVCCPDEALEWKRRRYHMVQEIVSYNPDVVCLQEVDHFEFLKKALKTQGYQGTFFPKPDSPCVYIKDNNGPDGCAIFFREDKFKLIDTQTRILEVWRVQSNQVAILVTLEDRRSGKRVCIATTHLKARNGALLSTLRNEQGKDLLEFVDANARGAPVILCGDFNAEPTEPIYATVMNHESLALGSAYSTKHNQEPSYTTWKIREEGEVCHTIDYVFYSKDRLNVEAVLKFPTGEEIGQDRVPSLKYPSDHFSLVCDFSYRDPKSE
ncbi:nocturnin isoform X2 [Bemisia tabaci]|uniref:nocturnin isoform X2 n=1 Tax=Bemisia tabaci TaxID=7038 RepID=UPI003B282290